jgi:hypothetical protein
VGQLKGVEGFEERFLIITHRKAMCLPSWWIAEGRLWKMEEDTHLWGGFSSY